ncbi:hypothetical protein BXZ70DRAFT_1078847 [Cristinia sonorae]|uniref:Protein YOP1 n=1 Tax=Cristinia sonorae TaxID=1940300 RepID=A0A8K0UKL7_9AGAR|nr:hypothetical protein BXZ70DRAFT_1078847 [Cristinia sonorae]
MPLLLPILRAFWVFSNVFDSFKTLRLPPPSARNGGHPTVRAMSQRKRNMKGCMTVWLVWCCFATYERTLDSVVGLFIPFYNEIKALVIIFFLLTRARGAEPIYLHILRPVIKPYVATLDVLLDVTHTLGDFLLLLASIPLDLLRSFYRPSEPSTAGSHHGTDDRTLYPAVDSVNPTGRNSHRREGADAGISPTDGTSETVHGAVRTRRRPLESAHSRTNSGRPQLSNTRSSSCGRQHPQTSGTQLEAHHEVWVPPQSAYEEDEVSSLPTPPREEPPSLVNGSAGYAPHPAEEWRRYEPFPSAYPATPLVSTARLPSDRTATSEGPRFDEPGDWRKYEAFPSAYPATPLNKSSRLPQFGHLPPQNHLAGVPEEASDAELSNAPFEHGEPDFQGSLEQPREFQNPDSACSSSDDHENNLGAHRAESTAMEEDMDIDDSYGDDEHDEDGDEDDFDVTLRTPATLSRLQNISKASSTLTDVSTGLSTTDNGSPLRTRTNSEASTLLNGSAGSGSDASSVAGQKRPLPFPDEGIRTRSTAIRKPPLSKPTKASTTPSVRPSRLAVASRQPTKTSESSAVDDSESEVGASNAGAVKRRRVGHATSSTGSRQVRPGVPGRSTSDRTIKGPKESSQMNTKTKTVPNSDTIRARTRNPRSTGHQAAASIRSAKRQDVNQSASESSVGEFPVSMGRRGAASSG